MADLQEAGARLLPAPDRDWLHQGRVRLVSTLATGSGDLHGLVAIGGSASGLPWSRHDGIVLGTVCKHFAERLENHLVRAASIRRGAHDRSAIDWRDEPCGCCSVCQRAWPADTLVCSCGGMTAAATVPLVIASKFRIDRLLGAGGMGVVYRARDIHLDRLVAVKTLSTRGLGRTRRLQKEARAMAAVHHPNLAVIFGVETWGDTSILVVEYLPGGTLADRLRQGPLAFLEAVHLGVFIADALDRVHAAGLLHRDIKPSNIGYTADGVPKLLDFGLTTNVASLVTREEPALTEDEARVVSVCLPVARVAPTSWLRGTPLYLSPEAAAGDLPSPAVDLWGLSMTLFEAVAGRHPLADRSGEILDRLRVFEAPDLLRYRPDAPESARRFFARALSRSAAERPRSAAELRNALQHLRAELG